MPHSRVTTRSFAVEEPSGARYLVAEIRIDCPSCGQHVIHIAGHHLRSIRDFCIQTIDEYPGLTGSEPKVESREAFTIQGGGGDPADN